MMMLLLVFPELVLGLMLGSRLVLGLVMLVVMKLLISLSVLVEEFVLMLLLLHPVRTCVSSEGVKVAAEWQYGLECLKYHLRSLLERHRLLLVVQCHNVLWHYWACNISLGMVPLEGANTQQWGHHRGSLVLLLLRLPVSLRRKLLMSSVAPFVVAFSADPARTDKLRLGSLLAAADTIPGHPQLDGILEALEGYYRCYGVSAWLVFWN